MTASGRRVALVTGGGRGIGEGCVRVFAAAGYAVVIAEKDELLGRRLEAELLGEGLEASFVPTDVTLEASLDAAVGAAVARYGRLDVLVNNAGRNRRTALLEMSQEDWDGLIRLNLTSVFWGCRLAMPHLVRSRGAVVNVSSLVGLQGQAEAVAYSAAKGGVIALTKTLALDFAPAGVRVNCLCPGDIRTPLYDEWLAEQDAPEASLERLVSSLPAGRLGTPEEAGQAVLFLAENRFLTGLALPFDGGKTLG